MTDARITALARDPRTGPVWPRIVTSRGKSYDAAPAAVAAFNAAAIEHGLGDEPLVPRRLLEHARGILAELGRDPARRRPGGSRADLVAALLRDEDVLDWSASEVVRVLDAMQDAHVLHEPEPERLVLTPLGEALRLLVDPDA